MKLTLSFAVLSAIVPVAVVADRGEPVPKHKVAKCDFTWDCDEDHQCAKGLICSDRHKKQLKAAGYDNRLANCGPSTNPAKPMYEVCFEPSLIYKSGGFGDPHFQTFDGTDYSFHGECDLVMARGENVEVHSRTTIVDNWSLISGTAMRLGNDVLEINNDNIVHVNGEKIVELPLKLSSDYTVSKTEEMFTSNEEADAKPESMVVYTIQLEKGVIKVSNYRKMLQVDVNSYLPGTEGMLGHQNVTGLVGRDRQTVVQSGNEMGAAWQVRDNEAKLFVDARAPQYPQACTVPVVTQRRLRQSAGELQRAENACANVIESRRHFCIEDSLRSGDVTMSNLYRKM